MMIIKFVAVYSYNGLSMNRNEHVLWMFNMITYNYKWI